MVPPTGSVGVLATPKGGLDVVNALAEGISLYLNAVRSVSGGSSLVYESR
jgi:hypothetical protein